MAYGVEYFYRKRGRESEGSKISLLPTEITSGADTLAGGTRIFSFNRDLDVIISMVAGETEIDILSSPHILVLDNQTASIQVGASEPILSSQQQTTQTTGTVVNQIEYRDTGTILTVTPRIAENDMITLDIRQEVSDAVPAEEATIGSPAFSTRITETSLVVKSGHSIYLGGIIDTKKDMRVKKVPLLGDIPILGNLFKSVRSVQTRTELMVLIKPHIINTTSEADTLTREFMGKLKQIAKMQKKEQVQSKVQ
jgi:type II secretory pathway component GspD/PulD (secretin)